MKTYYKPGEKCPVSGQWEIIDRDLFATGYEITLSKGERFPPQRKRKGCTYRVLDATRHERP